MIKELPEEFKEILLSIYNAVWKHGFISREWREYQVIFIDKIGKEKVWPISLSSWMGKIMERMVSERLVWWIEKNQILYPMQNGFRRGKSCLENLAKLMAEVRSQGLVGGYYLAAFLDVSSAYDNVNLNLYNRWKKKIARKVYTILLKTGYNLGIQNS